MGPCLSFHSVPYSLIIEMKPHTFFQNMAISKTERTLKDTTSQTTIIDAYFDRRFRFIQTQIKVLFKFSQHTVCRRSGEPKFKRETVFEFLQTKVKCFSVE